MTDKKLSRRGFVLAAIAAAGILGVPRRWLPGGTALADMPAQPDLAELVKLLFPHPGLSAQVYAEFADVFLSLFLANPDAAGLLDLADASLDAEVDGDWIEADEDQQIAALIAIQDESFFAAILEAVRGVFYNYPPVWVQIRYPGSSKQFGGYINRGFDDIAWLPEVES